MNPLNIEEINKISPYKVYNDPITGYVYFVTDYGIQLIIDFMEDDLFVRLVMENRKPVAVCSLHGLRHMNTQAISLV